MRKIGITCISRDIEDIILDQDIHSETQSNKELANMFKNPWEKLDVRFYEHDGICGLVLITNVYDGISAEIYTETFYNKFLDLDYLVQSAGYELLKLSYLMLEQELINPFIEIKSENLIYFKDNDEQEFEGIGTCYEEALASMLSQIFSYYAE